LQDRGIAVEIYGQDAPAGFLDDRAKRALGAECSCYVSPLPPWAGFGLAQHECFAAGVPVAGLIWGDLREEMPGYGGLTESLDDLADQVVRICTDESYAQQLSAIGLDYIARHRTMLTMEVAVERLVDELP
jgi:hypothetical protein